MAFHPYLFFNGNCRDAFNRYQEIFGGEIFMMAMKEMPPGEQPVPPEQADLIMHAALMIGDDLLMGSDAPDDPNFGADARMQVNYAVKEVAEAQRSFAALADGGEVTMPIAETFWSPMFGMCVDRFGTPWMVNAEQPSA